MNEQQVKPLWTDDEIYRTTDHLKQTVLHKNRICEMVSLGATEGLAEQIRDDMQDALDAANAQAAEIAQLRAQLKGNEEVNEEWQRITGKARQHMEDALDKNTELKAENEQLRAQLAKLEGQRINSSEMAGAIVYDALIDESRATMKDETKATVLEALRYHKYSLTAMPVAVPPSKAQLDSIDAAISDIEAGAGCEPDENGLLPCPFCGGKASLDTTHPNGDTYHVTCLADGCAGNTYIPDRSWDKPEWAQDAWNRRTTAQQPDSEATP